MLYSQLFPKTKREAPKDEVSVNAQLLTRGGFINKLQSGVYSFLPLGQIVHEKIKSIVRKNMNQIGGQEIQMPALQPKELWIKTGRWDTFDSMYQFKDQAGHDLGLAPSHEEVVVKITAEYVRSYKDLPLSLYQIHTKFRAELRSQSGLLRGREFTMKDLYSFHTSEEDLSDYYEIVKGQYLAIFKEIGLDTLVTEASGGMFTKEYSHEFQVLSETGEDTIYHCSNGDFSQNKEIANVKTGDKCPFCDGEILESRGIEVGNIFRLGDKYTQALNVKYVDQDGVEKYPIMGCYGIGIGRVMGSVVEVHHDDAGIMWPEAIAPYQIYLINIGDSTYEKANEIYNQLFNTGKEVLWDDRSESAGVKFADADLIGLPTRVLVSEKTLAENTAEVKKRNSEDTIRLPLEQLKSL